MVPNISEISPLLPTRGNYLEHQKPVQHNERREFVAETYCVQDRTKPEPLPRNQAYGYLLMLVAALFFCTMTLLSRAVLAYEGVSVPTLVFFRGPTQAALVYLTALILDDGSKTFRVPRECLPLLAMRGVCGAVALALVYGAIRLVPLGVAISLYFINPIFTFLLGRLVLGERAGIQESLASVLSIGGVWLISNPSTKIDTSGIQVSSYMFGAGLAIMGAGVVSVAMVCIRSLSSRIHPLVNVMSHAMGASVLGLCMGGPNMDELKNNPRAVLLIAGACLAGFAGQCLFNTAFKYCRAGTGSVLRTIDVPLSYILAFLFLDEKPNLTSLLGSLFVVSGVVLIGLNEIKK